MTTTQVEVRVQANGGKCLGAAVAATPPVLLVGPFAGSPNVPVPIGNTSSVMVKVPRSPLPIVPA